MSYLIGREKARSRHCKSLLQASTGQLQKLYHLAPNCPSGFHSTYQKQTNQKVEMSETAFTNHPILF